MYVEITDCKRFMALYGTPEEISLVTTALTKEIPNAWLLKKISNVRITERKFISDVANLVPIGLWIAVIKICKVCNMRCDLSPNMQSYIMQFQFDRAAFDQWLDTFFDGAIGYDSEGKPFDFRPYNYQRDASYKLLQFRRCLGSISTSAGKTLISFIIYAYLETHNLLKPDERFVVIVPNKDLVNQTADEFVKTNSWLANPIKLDIGVLYSNMAKKMKEQSDTCRILVSTYQSLRTKKPEYLHRFGGCIIDEAHHANAMSCIGIITKAINLRYCIGVSGTIPKEDTYEYLSLCSYIGGGTVYTYTPEDLIKEKKGTPLEVEFLVLNWASEKQKQEMWTLRMSKNPDDPTAGSKVLKAEELLINSSYTRLKYICEEIIRVTRDGSNALVLFADIKNGYGRKLYDYIKENSDSPVFYVDGNTPVENRKWIKEQVESNERAICVASQGTFGEGTNIKRLHYIFFTGGFSKSSNLMTQVAGRGLRLFEGKDKVVLYDIVDDLRYGGDVGRSYYNYSYQHYRERKKVYGDLKYPMKKRVVSFG